MNAQKIGRALNFASRQQSRYLANGLGHLGISPKTLPFFLTVAGNEGISQTSLAEKIVIDKTRTTKAVDCLENAGYLRREKDAGDHRINDLFLTAEGRRVLPEVRAVLDSIDGLLTDDFNEEELRMFIRMLEAFGTALRDACVRNGGCGEAG